MLLALENCYLPVNHCLLPPAELLSMGPSPLPSATPCLPFHHCFLLPTPCLLLTLRLELTAVCFTLHVVRPTAFCCLLLAFHPLPFYVLAAF